MNEFEIKELRVKLDEISKLIGFFCPKNGNGSPELTLAFRSCQLSKMHLGKVLKEMGIANPYPESKNPANEKIEATADSATSEQSADWNEFSKIQKIKYLRSELEKIENKLKWTKEYAEYSDWQKDEDIILSMRDSKRYCSESSMWLGIELGAIRDSLIPSESTNG